MLEYKQHGMYIRVFYYYPRSYVSARETAAAAAAREIFKCFLIPRSLFAGGTSSRASVTDRCAAGPGIQTLAGHQEQRAGACP